MAVGPRERVVLTLFVGGGEEIADVLGGAVVQRGEDAGEAQHDGQLVDEARGGVAAARGEEASVGLARVAVGVQVEPARVPLEHGADVVRDGGVLRVDLLANAD